MAALQIAKTNLNEKTIATSFLDELVAKGLIEESLVERIIQDEDLAHFFIPEKAKKKKPPQKKTSEKKANKSSETKAPKVSDTERNSQEFDSCRCCARIWKAEGGLGFDNIQCNSKNMVSAEEAKKILLALDPAPTEEEADKFLEGYQGTFCKKHMTQDFMMPNGYWLGKVNESRPEDPKLPSGSITKGYTEDYKAHTWMYDENGEKVEKKGRRSSPKKQKKAEENIEENIEENVEDLTTSQEAAAGTGLPKKDGKENDEMEEFLKWKKEQHPESCDAEEKNEVNGENVPESGEETEDMSDGEEKEDSEYIVDGIEYIKHWDEDEKAWIILEPEEYGKIGVPKEDGGIGFDSDEEDAHMERVNAAN